MLSTCVRNFKPFRMNRNFHRNWQTHSRVIIINLFLTSSSRFVLRIMVYIRFCFWSLLLLLFLSLSVIFCHSILCSQYIFFHSKPIAILLGHLKIPFEEIKQALLAMDEKKFTESHLRQLLLYAPDKEEVRTSKPTAEL